MATVARSVYYEISRYGRSAGAGPLVEGTEIFNKEGKYSVEHVAHELQISKTTLYKYLRQRGGEIGPTAQNLIATT